MAPFVAVPGGAQAEIFYRLGGEVLQNRLWFLQDFPPADQDAIDALALGLSNFWIAQMVPLLSSDIEFRGVRSSDWSDDPPPLTSEVHISVFGGTSSPSYSANVALVIPFRWPNFANRLKRNKHYLPGIPDSGISLNTPDATFADAVFEVYVALIDDAPFFYPSNRWRWAVSSAWEAGELRSEQYTQLCIGPPRPETFKIGQRRKRLPSS